MIRVGLIGFGKTGKIIAAELLNEKDIELVWVVRKSHSEEAEYAGELLGQHKEQGKIFCSDGLDFNLFLGENPADIIVDFSHYSTVNLYHEAIRSHRTILISAISNYPDDELEKIYSISKNNPVLYSPNITLGINFLIVISEVLQKIVPWADIEIIEEHFRTKPEISGTAVRIADILNLDKEKHVNSIRIGGIVGKHEVLFGLPNQTIRLMHETNNRAAFGQGIIFGIRYMVDKTAPGSYTMDQIIKQKFVSSINTIVI